jgi:hypothetical protein
MGEEGRKGQAMFLRNISMGIGFLLIPSLEELEVLVSLIAILHTDALLPRLFRPATL